MFPTYEEIKNYSDAALLNELKSAAVVLSETGGTRQERIETSRYITRLQNEILGRMKGE